MAENPHPLQTRSCADLPLGLSWRSLPFPQATQQHLAVRLGDGKDANPDQARGEVWREGEVFVYHDTAWKAAL